MSSATTPFSWFPPPLRARTDPVRTAQDGRALAIGGVAIGLPVVQAALSGYSDGPMRIVARRLGAPYTLAEVMIDRFVNELRDRRRTRHHLLVRDEEHPVGAQLMGADAEEFGPAARRLVDAGFDVIDVNFGCPVRSALGGCRGGFHLGQPAAALEIVERVLDSVGAAVPVTLKMRRGIDLTEPSRARFFEILDGAFARGVAAITVHGRTVVQRYDGPSDWDFLREVKLHAGARTILGSGDVFTAQACLDMLSYTGVDGVSVARGAIGNPWIFAQARDLLEGRPAREPGLAEQRRVLEMHCELCLETDPATASATMRKFGIKFARLHPRTAEVFQEFVAVRSLEDWRAVIARWYRE